MVFNKGGTRSSSGDGKSMPCGFGTRIFICRSYEGYNEGLNGIQKLESVSKLHESNMKFDLCNEEDRRRALDSHHQPHQLD